MVCFKTKERRMESCFFFRSEAFVFFFFYIAHANFIATVSDSSGSDPKRRVSATYAATILLFLLFPCVLEQEVTWTFFLFLFVFFFSQLLLLGFCFCFSGGAHFDFCVWRGKKTRAKKKKEQKIIINIL